MQQSAQLSLHALFMNGASNVLRFGLQMEPSSFRISNPSAFDYWAVTQGRNIAQLEIAVSSVGLSVVAEGMGVMTATHQLGSLGLRMSGMVGSMPRSPTQNEVIW